VVELLDGRGETLPPEHRHILLGYFPLAVRLGEALWEIPLSLAEGGFLQKVLRSEHLYVHMPPTARFVLPGNAKAAVPAHQDVSYNKHLSAFCVVWVPLVAIDRRCGGMAAYPRTEALGEIFAGPAVAPSEGWLPGIDLAGRERIELQPLAPGDAVILASGTAHESLPNSSDGIRLSVDFRFFGDPAHTSKHYLDLARRVVVAPAA
jgi:ectoine hydroxylase-related dioxygenase (phytanoyl-CoA dioxygenase family)